MPENNDINYQPQTQGFSFSDKEIQKEKRQTEFKSFFINLFLGLLIILFFLSVIFFSFNYFRIISLSNLNPIFKMLPLISLPPTAKYNPDTNLWTIQGTFYQYDNEKIKIKITPLKATEFIYNQDSRLELKKSTSTDDTNTLVGTLFDLDQKQNLGKKVEVEYFIQNKEYFISRITLYN